MTEEARLVETGAGLAPQSEGWFVVNVRDAAWLRNDHFGARANFETNGRMVTGNPSLELLQFPQVGVTLFVFEPGKPSTMYHGESDQEDFLVLQGEVLLIVEGQERLLKPWDFFHAAPHTMHSFVGAGDGPAVMVMVGGRDPEGTILYPRDETALQHGAGVEADTPSPQEAYARFPHWRLERPEGWDALPWAQEES